MAIQSSTTVGAYAAKAHLSELLEKVAGGAEITITRHGTPVAKLVPVKKQSTPEQRRAAMEAWRKTAKGLSLRGLKIRDLINEGRR